MQNPSEEFEELGKNLGEEFGHPLSPHCLTRMKWKLGMIRVDSKGLSDLATEVGPKRSAFQVSPQSTIKQWNKTMGVHNHTPGSLLQTVGVQDQTRISHPGSARITSSWISPGSAGSAGSDPGSDFPGFRCPGSVSQDQITQALMSYFCRISLFHSCRIQLFTGKLSQYTCMHLNNDT